MKWIVGIFLAFSPVMADAQSAEKDTIKFQRNGSDQQAELNSGSSSSVVLMRKEITICPMPERFELLNDGGLTQYKLYRDELKRLPYTSVNDAISLLPGVYQQQRGAGLNIYGGR